ncbi:hypothetical protein F4780DRAFT_329301 [Xylariomycetidae sp. FL0641]|nr:hypothetical protein F4780DRAFT_329301 [Xylariomycetidae sp. FL0641]
MASRALAPGRASPVFQLHALEILQAAQHGHEALEVARLAELEVGVDALPAEGEDEGAGLVALEVDLLEDPAAGGVAGEARGGEPLGLGHEGLDLVGGVGHVVGAEGGGVGEVDPEDLGRGLLLAVVRAAVQHRRRERLEGHVAQVRHRVAAALGRQHRALRLAQPRQHRPVRLRLREGRVRRHAPRPVDPQPQQVLVLVRPPVAHPRAPRLRQDRLRHRVRRRGDGLLGRGGRERHADGFGDRGHGNGGGGGDGGVGTLVVVKWRRIPVKVRQVSMCWGG